MNILKKYLWQRFVYVLLIMFPVDNLANNNNFDNNWEDKLAFSKAVDIYQDNFDNEILCNEKFENCGANREIFKNLFKKKDTILDDIEKLQKPLLTTTGGLFHNEPFSPCNCGINFHLVDLGRNYFPRYLHTGICKKDSCGRLLHCKEKYYKVRVLKLKDLDTVPEPDVILPDQLKDQWTTELKRIVVACVCTPHA